MPTARGPESGNLHDPGALGPAGIFRVIQMPAVKTQLPLQRLDDPTMTSTQRLPARRRTR
eukprot:4126357-Pyramimonas_sp.AAC.1